ncbi:MAG: ABC transporter permease subunit [Bacteriovorax sp.]|jgi:NitT/TauT family transport system permease protein
MKRIFTILPFLVLGALWHVGVIFNFIDSQFFPSPVMFTLKLFMLFLNSDFVYDCLRSAYRLLAGTLISIPLSFIAAFACSHCPKFDRIFNPLVAFTFPLPKVAIFPLTLLVLGIGDSSKIFVISLGMFYLLFINLRLGLLHMKGGEVGELVKIFKINKKNYFFEIILKGIRVDFFKGLKLALGYGLTLVVVSEFSMSKDGVGNFIWKAWEQFNIIDMYAAVLLLSLVGFVIYLVLDHLIGRFEKYYH